MKEKIKIYLEKKFSQFISYMNFNIIDNISSQIDYEKNSIYNLMQVDNLFYKYLCDLSKNDMDLSILLVESNYKTLDFIIRKMNINLTSKEKDDILFQAIENYDGIKSFSVYILTILKSYLKQKNTKVDKNVETNVVDNSLYDLVLSLFDSDTFMKVFDTLDDIEKEIITLKLGVNGKVLSSNDIALDFNVDIKFINYVLKNIVAKFNNTLSNLIDKMYIK